MGLHSAGWLISQPAVDWNAQESSRRKAAAPALVPSPLERAAEVDYGDYITALDARMRDRWINMWGYGRPWRTTHDETVAKGAPLPTVDDWAEQMAYLVTLIGADHAGLGLDLMAGGLWLKDFDATSYPRLTEAMMKRGMAREEILKVLGENWLRAFETAKAP